MLSIRSRVYGEGKHPWIADGKSRFVYLGEKQRKEETEEKVEEKKDLFHS